MCRPGRNLGASCIAFGVGVLLATILQSVCFSILIAVGAIVVGVLCLKG